MTPRKVPTTIAGDHFLHVRMSSDIPSTGRRYPQILVTTVPIQELGAGHDEGTVPIQERLDQGNTIVVQPFGVPLDSVELQLEFCDHFAWNVNAQCPMANIYQDSQKANAPPPAPVPVMAELAGYDRPVLFDVYASTSRVYVFIEGKPAGCGILPQGKMTPGDVTVAFGSVIYHSGIDEMVGQKDAPQEYLARWSQANTAHHFDNFGIANTVQLPAWDEKILPCSSEWNE
jgi:hypothetical protein